MSSVIAGPGARMSIRRAVIGVLASVVLAVPLAAQAVDEPVLKDSAIADAVDDELMFDPAILSQSVHVAVRRGVVTLTGVTDNILAKERATKIARSVKGVRTVVNAIEVKPPPYRDGVSLRSHVVSALHDDPATEKYQIAVTADLGGLVTLRGTVDSWQERNLAATVAKSVAGVTDLNNELKVEYGEMSRTDDEIRAEVTRRLNWDVLVDSAAVDVAVNDGVVELSGVVASAAERTRAKSFAHVIGVREVVIDDLTVHDWARSAYKREAVPVYVDDAEVERAIRNAIEYDPRLAESDINIDVKKGTVTLRGQVSGMAARRSAETDARNTVGAIEVVNRLKIQRAGEQADADIKQRVESALARDPFVDTHEISVIVSGGTVKLYGLVDDYFEKSRADQAVERVKGVVATANNLDVRNRHSALIYDPFVSIYPAELYDWYDYSPKVSFKHDRKIREAIEDQLWWSPFVDADEVAVAVDDGRATLTGEVDSYAEWQAAAENAWEGGAIWVDNDLTISNSQS